METMNLTEIYTCYNKEAVVDLKGRKPGMIIDRLDRMLIHGKEAQKEKNFKSAYIYFKRWIRCVDWLQKQNVSEDLVKKYYPSDKIKHVKNLLAKVMTSIEIEHVFKQKLSQISNNSITKSNKDLTTDNDVDISLQLPEIPNDEPQPKDKNEITCSELFRLLTQDTKNKEKKVLIIDVRKKKEYTESRISFEENMVNIPAEHIEQKKGPGDYSCLLDQESDYKFRRRLSKVTNTVVLLDTNSSIDTMNNTSAIATFKKCLENKDPYSQSRRLFVLKGGFKEWMNMYSSYVTASSVEHSTLKNEYLSDTHDNSNYARSPVLSGNHRSGTATKANSTFSSQASVKSNRSSLYNDSQARPLTYQTPGQINGTYNPPENNGSINSYEQKLLHRNNIGEGPWVKLEKMRPQVDRSNKPGKRPQQTVDEERKKLEKEIEEIRNEMIQLERRLDIDKEDDPWFTEQLEIYKKKEQDMVNELMRILEPKNTKLYPELDAKISAMTLGTRMRASRAPKIIMSDEKENIQVPRKPPIKVEPMQSLPKIESPAPTKMPTTPSAPQKMEVDDDEEIHKARLKSENPSVNTGLKRSLSSPNLMQNKEGRRGMPPVDRSTKPKENLENTDPYANKPPTILASRSHKDKETRMEPIYASTGSHPGITGLKNLGNSCYMNSIIQCLSNTAYLAQYFTSNDYSNDINKNDKTANVAEEVAQVIKALWRGQYKSISPRDLKVVVGQYRLQFESYDQQDSHEFLMFLLDWMHNDLKKKDKTSYFRQLTTAEKEWEKSMDGQRSIISQLFFGQLRSTIECQNCGENSTTYETFNSLTMSLPASNKCTLDDCVRKFVSGQKVSGWKCPNCKVPRDGLKKFDFAKLPYIIVIHLNRFGETGGWLEKKNTAVEFPLNNFDLRKYLVLDNESNNDVNMYNTSYNLYAMSNHYGTMDGGHYTAYCKSNPLNKWYKYDDHTVTEVASNTVKNQSNSAYLLFYAMPVTEPFINS